MTRKEPRRTSCFSLCMSVSLMFRPKNLGSRTMFLSSLMCQNIVAAPSKNQSTRSARPRPLPRAREPSHRLRGRCVHADVCPFSARRRRRLRTERLGTIERSDQRVKRSGSFPPTEFPAPSARRLHLPHSGLLQLAVSACKSLYGGQSENRKKFLSSRGG